MGVIQWISEKIDSNRIKTKENYLRHLAAKVEAQEKLIELEKNTQSVREYLQSMKKPEIPKKSDTKRVVVYKRE